MKVGMFLLVEPMQPVSRQLELVKSFGFDYADITDTHAGGSMFNSAGFLPAVSLDANPFEVARMFKKYEVTPTTVCAHAALFEPSNPAQFQTDEIMKAIRFAAALGIKDVVTTDTEPVSDWAKNLTYEQQIFTICEKLYVPCQMAEDYGVNLLIEPHGPISGNLQGMRDIFKFLDNPKALGVNMDTGNSWLGGIDPVEMAKEFKDKIHHIHWKDLGEEWIPHRGKKFGCGFSTIALGDGVIDVKGVIDVLKDKDIPYSTLEIVGNEDILRRSKAFVEKHWQ